MKYRMDNNLVLGLIILLMASFVKELRGNLDQSPDCGLRAQDNQPSNRRTKRIIGGQKARINSWPWLVNFIDKTTSLQYCSGSIIDRYWILTAAHCFIYYESNKKVSLPVSNYVYHIGDYEYNVTDVHEFTVEASQLFIHPHYKLPDSKQAGDNDISMIKLKRPLNFTGQVRTICLPTKDTNFPPGHACYLVGWGNIVDNTSYHRSLTLKEAKLDLVSLEKCNSKQSYNGLVPKSALCAGFSQGGTDGCFGDSGGPLQCARNGTWTIVGIMSWGLGCARPNLYGVYSNVKHLLPFVKAVLKGPNKNLTAYYQHETKFIKTKLLYELFTDKGRFSDFDLVRNLQLRPCQIKLLSKTTLDDLSFVAKNTNLVSNLITLKNISETFLKQYSKLAIYVKFKAAIEEFNISFSELLKVTHLSKNKLLNFETKNISKILHEAIKRYYINSHTSRLHNLATTLIIQNSSFFRVDFAGVKKHFDNYSMNDIKKIDDNVLRKILVKSNKAFFTKQLSIHKISIFFKIKLERLLRMTVAEVLSKILSIRLSDCLPTYKFIKCQLFVLKTISISSVTKTGRATLCHVTETILKSRRMFFIN